MSNEIDHISKIMDMEEKQSLDKLKSRYKRMPLWVTISPIITGGFITLFHQETFGKESVITIEILLCCLVLSIFINRSRELKMFWIIEQLETNYLKK